MIKIISILLLLLTYPVQANSIYADSRFCGEPKRNDSGEIIRSAAVKNQFKKMYPLPAALDPRDYHINHIIPLVCGGCDNVNNLMWMHRDAKACADDYCQDRHERLTMCPKDYSK